MKRHGALIATWLLLVAAGSAAAADKPPTEADFYKIVALPIPKGIVLEPGGMDLMPDGRLAVATRRGEIYFIENAFADPPVFPFSKGRTGERPKLKFKRYAHGLHEVLGLAYKNGWLYATQRCDLSRLKDLNGDGRADLFETFNDGWELTGDYHEFAFSSPFDKQGNIWVVLCLTKSISSGCKYRGWCVRITPAGKLIPTAGGIRSPGGIGMNAVGDVFYTDNQGPWNGTCSLKWLRPGSFQGHPAGNKWYSIAAETMGPQPRDPKSGSRIMVEAKKIPQLEPSAVLFPYKKMGQSATGIACDLTGGKFGPFENQLFVGDLTHSTVMRVFLEKINGHYQGVCFPFRSGLASGSLALLMTKHGSLLVGGTNRGWGSRGTQPFSLERLLWTGRVPFEVHEMRAKPDGFELSFTKPIDPKTAGDPKSYRLSTYTYIYQASYGSPEVDHTTPLIEQVTVAEDGKSVRLIIDALQAGHVHELHLDGIRSAGNLPLLHKVAYYTLNYIPVKK